MKFIIRFAQIHETFRVAEIEALALIESVNLTILYHDLESPICVVELPSVESAKRLIRRSLLAQSIHELWGQGRTMEELHQSIKETPEMWKAYRHSSFKCTLESFRGTRSVEARLRIFESLDYLPLHGLIKMSNPDEVFTVFEVWPDKSVPLGIENPDMVYFGRFVCASSRDLILRYDLKKRDWISTTSMDSELALVTANIALAGPGKLFYDPFVGTGSFPIACAHFGAMAWGSDIDGRAIRGEGGRRSLRGNFEQYALQSRVGDFFSADLTNVPLRPMRMWDGIVCDPPYGVREGLRVLGVKDPEKTPWVEKAGRERYRDADFVPPKKPYSFFAMLDDILDFAATTLVDGGRLSFWMPSANEDEEIAVPSHPCLQEVAVCAQEFQKWTRKLITYQRIPDAQVSMSAVEAHLARPKVDAEGNNASDLNPFRRAYFNGFRTGEE